MFLETIPHPRRRTQRVPHREERDDDREWIAFLDDLSDEGARSCGDRTARRTALGGFVDVRRDRRAAGSSVPRDERTYRAERRRALRVPGSHASGLSGLAAIPGRRASRPTTRRVRCVARAVRAACPDARLCTEREWERAARGADARDFPHGDAAASRTTPTSISPTAERAAPSVPTRSGATRRRRARSASHDMVGQRLGHRASVLDRGSVRRARRELLPGPPSVLSTEPRSRSAPSLVTTPSAFASAPIAPLVTKGPLMSIRTTLEPLALLASPLSVVLIVKRAHVRAVARPRASPPKASRAQGITTQGITTQGIDHPGPHHPGPHHPRPDHPRHSAPRASPPKASPPKASPPKASPPRAHAAQGITTQGVTSQGITSQGITTQGITTQGIDQPRACSCAGIDRVRAFFGAAPDPRHRPRGRRCLARKPSGPSDRRSDRLHGRRRIRWTASELRAGPAQAAQRRHRHPGSYIYVPGSGGTRRRLEGSLWNLVWPACPTSTRSARPTESCTERRCASAPRIRSARERDMCIEGVLQ